MNHSLYHNWSHVERHTMEVDNSGASEQRFRAPPIMSF